MFRLNQSALSVSLRVFNVKHLIADIFGVEWGFFQKRNCPLCVCAVMRGLVRLSQSLNSFIIERTEPKQSLMFLIKSSANSAASNGFNNTAQFFCLCFFFFLCPDMKVWTCFVQNLSSKFPNSETKRGRQTFHSRGPANLFQGSWLSTSEHSAPSHPHYYTAANPVSQIPAPWTPSRKSYWCCTFLHML